MLAFARVALLRLVRDRTNAFFVVVLPLLLVLLIGIQFSDGADQPVVGVVAAEPAVGAALEEGGLAVRVLADAAAARAAVAEGVVDGAVVVPTDGRARWVGTPTQGTPTLRVRAAGAVARAGVVDRAVAALAATGNDLPADDVRAVTPTGPAVTRTTRGVDELATEFAGLGRFELGASQQLLLFVFITALTASGTLVQVRRWGVVDRALVGPTSPAQVLGGLALGQLAVSLVQAVVIVAGTSLLFDVGWGDPVASTVVVVLFALVATAAGLLLSSLLDDESQVGGIAVPLALALAALGGSMVPLELLPDALLPVTAATPHAWGNRAFAEIVRRGGGVGDVLPELGVLAAMALGLGGAAAVALRRRMLR